MIHKNSKLTLSAAALLTIASIGHAQNMSVSNSYSRSWGDSDAGASIYAYAHGAAGQSSRYVSSSGSGWTIAPYWETTYAGSAYGRVLANIRFLGSSRRAGEFRMSLQAAAVKKSYVGGSTRWSSATSGGSTYLKVGSSVLWNTSFTSYFNNRASLRLRIMTPSLVVPMGAGLAALSGRAYGRVRAAMDGTFNPFYGQVNMNGEAAVSGDASASATVISLLLFANATATFSANEQKLDANSLRIQPGIVGSGWGRSGSIRAVSGSMRGVVRVNGALPPYIPISTTLANWSKSTTVKTLF